MRQGGILSTDLYKLYDNGVFDRLQLTGVGCHIGDISCVVPGCSDDQMMQPSWQKTRESYRFW